MPLKPWLRSSCVCATRTRSVVPSIVTSAPLRKREKRDGGERNPPIAKFTAPRRDARGAAAPAENKSHVPESVRTTAVTRTVIRIDMLIFEYTTQAVSVLLCMIQQEPTISFLSKWCSKKMYGRVKAETKELCTCRTQRRGYEKKCLAADSFPADNKAHPDMHLLSRQARLRAYQSTGSRRTSPGSASR